MNSKPFTVTYVSKIQTSRGSALKQREASFKTKAQLDAFIRTRTANGMMLSILQVTQILS